MYQDTLGRLHLTAGQPIIDNLAIVTAAYSAAPGDYVLANAAVAAFTITLPNPFGNAGALVTIKKTDNTPNAITVQSAVGTVDGLASLAFLQAYLSQTFVCDGQNWFTHGTPPMMLKATTPAAGTALINGTPTILTWTAPNDGKLHRAKVIGAVVVTSLETGGAVTVTAGAAAAATVDAGAHAAGTFSLTMTEVILQPNATISVSQTALTAGAASLFAEIWGS